MPQHRGGADLTLHHFMRRELVTDLAAAGFDVRELVPVGTDRPLRVPWFLPAMRAYGFLVAAG
jgi:hypothetical protein